MLRLFLSCSEFRIRKANKIINVHVKLIFKQIIQSSILIFVFFI